MNVLSLDGGGVRSIMEILILKRLSVKFDVFAGTSAGSIIALALAYGMDINIVNDMYIKIVNHTFKKSLIREITSGDGLLYPLYSNKGLIEVLTETFGDKTLGDLKYKVIVPSIKLTDKGPIPEIFHNLTDVYMNEKIVDVALRSTAASTYFQPYQGYIDSGICANNPAVIAISLVPVKRMLSISTGYFPEKVSEIKLADLFINSSISLTDTISKSLLGDKYHRINPILPSDIKLDDVDKIKILEEIGLNYDLTSVIDWLS